MCVHLHARVATSECVCRRVCFASVSASVRVYVSCASACLSVYVRVCVHVCASACMCVCLTCMGRGGGFGVSWGLLHSCPCRMGTQPALPTEPPLCTSNTPPRRKGSEVWGRRGRCEGKKSCQKNIPVSQQLQKPFFPRILSDCDEKFSER